LVFVTVPLGLATPDPTPAGGELFTSGTPVPSTARGLSRHTMTSVPTNGLSLKKHGSSISILAALVA
jgi:hypothetical protein